MSTKETVLANSSQATESEEPSPTSNEGESNAAKKVDRAGITSAETITVRKTSITTSSSAQPLSEETFGGEENTANVVAVFVVRFDTKHGNVIEWQYPPDFDLKGVEFSAMPSGLHAVSQDVIYFTNPTHYGLSVFENVPTFDQSQDRGAHMAAVGILVLPTPGTGRCGQPWKHLEFLKSQAKKHVNFSDDYSDLQGFFQQHCLSPNSIEPDLLEMSETDGGASSSKPSNPRAYSRNRLASEISTWASSSQQGLSLSPSHPAQHFHNFIKNCGPAIFVLWKAALLKKRILFYTTPPIENACYFVYGTCLLGNLSSSISHLLSATTDKIKPLFNVGVNEIDMLKHTEGGFVACTTDRIFQLKSDIYDLLVNLPSPDARKTNPSIVLSPESLISNQISTKINRDDIRRYRVLLGILATYGENYFEEERDGGNIIDTWRKMTFGGWFWWYGRNNGYRQLSNEDEDTGSFHNNNTNGETTNSLADLGSSKHTSEMELELIKFFNVSSSNLLSTLHSIINKSEGFEGASEKIYIYPDHMEQLGLNPREDGAFVEALAYIYFGREVEVVGKGGNIFTKLMDLIWGILEFVFRCFQV